MIKEEAYLLQLHTGSNDLHEIDAVLSGTTKPIGGFWTSTFQPQTEYASDWVKYWDSIVKLFGDKDFKKAILLKVDPKAKIRHIDGATDFEKLILQYSRISASMLKITSIRFASSCLIDWEALAKEYDGVHLTRNGAIETQANDRFAGWSCESTCWFRHAFITAIPYFEKVIRKKVVETSTALIKTI